MSCKGSPWVESKGWELHDTFGKKGWGWFQDSEGRPDTGEALHAMLKCLGFVLLQTGKRINHSCVIFASFRHVGTQFCSTQ